MNKTKKTFREKYVGDKAFYKMFFTLVLPLVIQQGITSFVNLLDNVMVGGLGTESISAVAIVNQIMMIFNLAIFGGLSGASIFGAQFFGKKDYEGMKHTFRFKLMFGLIISVIAIIIFQTGGETFISMFLKGESDGGDLALTLEFGKRYLKVMLIGLIPFMLVQTYTGTLRESGETFAPMVGSTSAIVINLVLNYCLIFGHFGFPKLGVEGAAIATIIARFFEMLYIMVYAHTHTNKFEYLKGVYKSLYVPANLIKKITITGTPLLLNEVLWSFGMTVINQSYSTRGLAAVAAVNISQTVWQLFSIGMIATGNGISILVGQKLGAGDKEGARDIDNKIMFTGFVLHVIMGIILAACSGIIPLLYNVDPEVRALSSSLLIVAAISLPIHIIVHSVYFTIRSGGKTVITFLFDCVYTWVVPVTLAFIMSRYTSIPVLWMYAVIQLIDIVKVGIGLVMLKSDFWLNNIVNE